MPGIGQGEAWHRPGSLAGYAQGLPAGRQDLKLRAGPKQGIGERGALLDQVLAVVQDQKRLPGLQVLDEHLGKRTVRHLAHAQRRG
jgi:hypothetical protein